MYYQTLEVFADWAAILTAVVATIAYVRFWGAQFKRQKTLESYLRNKKLGHYDQTQHSVVHLMAVLKMTESEVLQAAFRSDRIHSMPGEDHRGRADGIFFEYDGDDIVVDRPL